ncbi:nucleotidyltransferase family protein [Luteipulveratus halotolerans]|uniref:nucleotidyltransferase family protein n=1 Tax=Luteipulveratus halotolerans TaxID=1631356 RepID=UPI000680C76D|nr:nucleotidyltransferase family protein [Luteipulveratus halotolerans]
MTQQTAFSISEAVELAYGLVAREAEALGVRVLGLKGPAAARQGFRERGPSTDADLLVDGRAEPVVQALRDLGWRTRVQSPAPRFFPDHSVELYHPRWPCDIDLHTFYPGFFEDPDVVFERLWESRETVELAGRAVDVPSRAGQALVIAVHAARTPDRPRSRSDRRRIVTMLRDDAAMRAEFASLATTFRSDQVLENLWAEIGVPVSGDLHPAEQLAWDRLLAGGGRSTAFHLYVALSTGGLRHRISAARAAAGIALRTASPRSRVLPDGSVKAPWWRRVPELVAEVRRARAVLRARTRAGRSGSQ